jgi:hypothetical protein
MPTPPDTTAYLYLGLAVVAVIMLVFIASLVIRYRNLRHDAETIAALED